MNGLYFVRCNWYDEYKEEDEIACAFVIATSYTDAVQKVTADFTYINSINVEEIQTPGICDMNCVYIPDDETIINAIREANDF